VNAQLDQEDRKMPQTADKTRGPDERYRAVYEPGPIREFFGSVGDGIVAVWEIVERVYKWFHPFSG
jgi:hypothetical protein